MYHGKLCVSEQDAHGDNRANVTSTRISQYLILMSPMTN